MRLIECPLFLMKGKPLSTSWARLNELATYVVSGDEAGILIAANIVSKKSKVYDLGRGPICEVAGCPLRGKLVAVG